MHVQCNQHFQSGMFEIFVVGLIIIGSVVVVYVGRPGRHADVDFGKACEGEG